MLFMQVLVFVFGLCIGSFLNVCIYRIPEQKSIAFPASHCPSCKHSLNPIDLIPVLGYFLNKGKCRYCGVKISLQYPFVELLTGIIFVLLFNKFFISIDFFKYAILISLLIIVFFVDMVRQEIPDEIIIFGLIVALLFNIYDIRATMVHGILGFVLGGGIFLLIAAITGGAMGGGDIKLMAVLGFFFGWRLILLISVIAFVIGAIISIFLMGTRIKGRKDYIPFGPFITIAAFIVIFHGTQIIRLYLDYMQI